MLLDELESQLGQILQELLLMELTEREKREKKKKSWEGDTGKFPCICYCVFPNLNGLAHVTERLWYIFI